MDKKRIVSGIKPSGDLTLGNYIGAIKQFVELQNQDDIDSFIFIADLHAITVPQNPGELRRRIYDILKLYIASGLQPGKTKLFIQSEITAHAQLAWILTCYSYMGELERMVQYKDIVQKNKNKQLPIGSGVLQYPPLMAADVLLYSPDVVPVGDDQSQHLELTRTLAERLNATTGQALFVVPGTHKTKQGARIMSLQNPTSKMSKSAENPKEYIALLDDPKKAAKKIKSAVTDSESIVKYDEKNKPGISNLLTIYAALENISILEAEKHFKDSQYGAFKSAVANSVETFLTQLQEKFYAMDDAYIDEILDKEKENIQQIADKKLHEVLHALGLGRY